MCNSGRLAGTASVLLWDDGVATKRWAQALPTFKSRAALLEGAAWGGPHFEGPGICSPSGVCLPLQVSTPSRPGPPRSHKPGRSPHPPQCCLGPLPLPRSGRCVMSSAEHSKRRKLEAPGNSTTSTALGRRGPMTEREAVRARVSGIAPPFRAPARRRNAPERSAPSPTSLPAGAQVGRRAAGRPGPAV